MSIRRTPRNFYDNSGSAKTPMLKRADKLDTSSEEQQFIQLLQHLVTVVSKEGSNNVALVVIAAMFFGFLVLAARPAQPPINPQQINLQNSPNTTITTQQQTQSQNYNLPKTQQMIEDDQPSGS